MKQRARQDEDKAERVAMILQAASDLWSRAPGSEFTMSDVAERAGIVKGTVYLYFPTKERLLLALYEQFLEDYLGEIDGALGKRAGRWSAASVAEVFTAALRGREAFLRLLPLVGCILEHNIDRTVALAFKRFTLQRMTSTAALVEGRVRTLDSGDGLRFLLRASSLLAGLANLAFPAPIIQQVFHDEPELSVLRVDLDREFLDGATALLHGMEKRT